LVRYTPPASFVGQASFTYTVGDGHQGFATATVTVDVATANQPPACETAYASPDEIWPPNHKKTYDVAIKGVRDPERHKVTIRVTRILQDEPTNTGGDGHTWIDGGLTTPSTAWVRAERMGGGDGRIYEIFFTATDANGASCTGAVRVGVPHDRHRPARDSGCRWDSTVKKGPLLYCGPGSGPPAGGGHDDDDRDDDDGDDDHQGGHRDDDDCDDDRRRKYHPKHHGDRGR
jgi:hypothetical protein